MDKLAQTCLDNLESPDPDIRYQAFLEFQAITTEKVDWAYDIWDDLVQDLTHADKDERVKQLALALIETEADLKYRKKYAAVWKHI